MVYPKGRFGPHTHSSAEAGVTMERRRATLPTDGIFVSAFITNHIIEEQADDVVQFNLKGVGWGYWATEGDAIQIGDASLFVQLHSILAKAGTYEIVTDLLNMDGTPVIVLDEQNRRVRPINRHLLEITGNDNVYSWTVNLHGLTVPIGSHYLSIAVRGATKAALLVQVYGPEKG